MNYRWKRMRILISSIRVKNTIIISLAEFFKRVVALKETGVKVLLAMGGYNRQLNGKSTRTQFIKHAVKFLEEHDFDGLELNLAYPLDWQVTCTYTFTPSPPSPKCKQACRILHGAEIFFQNFSIVCTQTIPEKDALVTLARELREAFWKRDLLFSVAALTDSDFVEQCKFCSNIIPTILKVCAYILVGWCTYWREKSKCFLFKSAYELAAISPFVDWFSLMSFDYHGYWEGKTDHIAPLIASSKNDSYLSDIVSSQYL